MYFPTRIANNSITLMDKIFVVNRRKYTVQPCINGLSDHDTQLLTLNNVSIPNNNIKPSFIRNIIAEFQSQLSWEQWDNIIGNNDVNNMFNNFLNTYLRCYYSSFPKR